MLDGPILFRSPAYRYRLQSDCDVSLFCGVIREGRLLLFVSGCVLEFDAAGQLMMVREDCPIPRSWLPEALRHQGCPDEEVTWVTELEFEEQVIEVLRFWLPDRQIGISDFPMRSDDLPRDPDLFTAEDWELVRSTEAYGGFMLQLGQGQGELWIDNNGKAQLHSK